MTQEELEILINQLISLKNRYEPQILTAARIEIVDRIPYPTDDIWQPLLPKFSKLTDDLERRLIDEVKNFSKNYKDVYAAISGIKSKFGLTQNIARVLFNTGFGAIRRKQKMDFNIANGIEYFLYLGNPPQRKFCKEHFNKVYHINEIYEMDNRQKLPVWIYCGGYNCNHEWLPVFKHDYDKFGISSRK